MASERHKNIDAELLMHPWPTGPFSGTVPSLEKNHCLFSIAVGQIV